MGVKCWYHNEERILVLHLPREYYTLRAKVKGALNQCPPPVELIWLIIGPESEKHRSSRPLSSAYVDDIPQTIKICNRELCVPVSKCYQSAIKARRPRVISSTPLPRRVVLPVEISSPNCRHASGVSGLYWHLPRVCLIVRY